MARDLSCSRILYWTTKNLKANLQNLSKVPDLAKVFKEEVFNKNIQPAILLIAKYIILTLRSNIVKKNAMNLSKYLAKQKNCCFSNPNESIEERRAVNVKLLP